MELTLVHIDRNDIGLSTAILHGGRIGHGVGEVHRLATAGRQGFNAVCGNDRSQLCHIRAAGHGDGDGIGGIVHRTGHAVDGEACDARGGRRGSLPLTTDGVVVAQLPQVVDQQDGDAVPVRQSFEDTDVLVVAGVGIHLAARAPDTLEGVDDHQAGGRVLPEELLDLLHQPAAELLRHHGEV